MNSDRIETEPGRFWLIGGKQSEKFINWNTDGYSYGVRITGLDGSHGIMMNRKRREELKDRLNKGQSFHLDFE